MEQMPQSDVLSPEQIYENLRASLAKTVGVDADVLKIVQDELLHPQVDEKTNLKQAVEKLLEQDSGPTGGFYRERELIEW